MCANQNEGTLDLQRMCSRQILNLNRREYRLNFFVSQSDIYFGHINGGMFKNTVEQHKGFRFVLACIIHKSPECFSEGVSREIPYLDAVCFFPFFDDTIDVLDGKRFSSTLATKYKFSRIRTLHQHIQFVKPILRVKVERNLSDFASLLFLFGKRSFIDDVGPSQRKYIRGPKCSAE